MKQEFQAANKNIQSIADRFEISNLLMDLAAAIDNNDIAALDDIFTADAFVDCAASIGIKGQYAEVKAFFELTPPVISVSQHLVSNANIHIDGDTATARTLCYDPQQLTGKDTEQALCYVDKFQRTDKGWRIVKRLQEQACASNSL